MGVPGAGHENASAEYSGVTIKNLLAEKTKDRNWEIAFSGANQDAVIEAAEFGIERDGSIPLGVNRDVVTKANESLRG